MKNLTIFSKHFWPENFKINDIALKLKEKLNIDVYTSKQNYNNLNYKFNHNYKNFKGIKIKYFSIYNKTKDNFFDIFFEYFFYALYLTYKINFFLKKDADISLTFATSPIFQAIPAIYFSKLKKIPSIIWVQDLWPEVLEDTGYVKNKYILKIIDKLVKLIYLNCDFILVQSDSFKRHLLKKYKLKKKVITLHQPSDYKFQKYDKKIKNIFYITYAGNFGKGQNFDVILKAFKSSKIHKNIKLILIGSGKKYEYIQNQIKINNLSRKIILRSYVKRNRLIKIFKSSSSFLITLNEGKSLNKTIPGKFQTYLAFGKPILVCSNSILNKIVVKNKLGFSCKSNDSEKLINNINQVYRLSSNKKKQIYLSSKRVYEKNFNIDIICLKLLDILKFVKKNYVKKTLF